MTQQRARGLAKLHLDEMARATRISTEADVDMRIDMCSLRHQLLMWWFDGHRDGERASESERESSREGDSDQIGHYMREENGKIERAGQRCCVLERTNMRVQGEDRVSRRGGLRV
jgi:hypothetical protein